MKRSNYQFFLTEPLSTSGSSVSVSTLIGTGETVSLSDTTSMVISYDNRTQVERIKGTVSSGTMTITARGLTNGESPTEDSTLKLAWRPGAIVTVTLFPDDIAEADATETVSGDWTFSGDIVHTGSVKVPVYADATARDAAITSPANGMLIYNTADGVNQQYISGAWADVDTGSTPNASDTVAGKVEIATTAEFNAGTDTGGTGASLSAAPSDIKTKNDSQDSSISANASNISTNTSNISTNASAISANTTAINNKTISESYVTGTRAATGTGVTVAHGLGKTPKIMHVYWSTSTLSGDGICNDGLNQTGKYVANSGHGIAASFINANTFTGTVTAVDSTNITFTWAGSATTVTFYIYCIA